MLSLSIARHPQCICLLFHQNMAGRWTLLPQYLSLTSYKEVHFLLSKHFDHRPLTTLSSLCRARFKGYL